MLLLLSQISLYPTDVRAMLDNCLQVPCTLSSPSSFSSSSFPSRVFASARIFFLLSSASASKGETDGAEGVTDKIARGDSPKSPWYGLQRHRETTRQTTTFHVPGVGVAKSVATSQSSVSTNLLVGSARNKLRATASFLAGTEGGTAGREDVTEMSKCGH